ncbi:MAG TPA: hypothetical protein VN721_17590 [Flavipsychrobacter sp.]|nr:hypothetical protein [Flavipsychrobacter sp.]
MSWTLIQSSEIDNWNEKLKQTQASFYQYPYYASALYHTAFSKCRFLKYIEGDKEVAFCTVIEINFYLFKVGIIDGGPVPLMQTDMSELLEGIKTFAKKRKYLYLQIMPFNKDLEAMIKKDVAFKEDVFFPFHKIEEAEFNIYKMPEDLLLKSYKLQGRRKIILAERVPFEYYKLENKITLKEIRELFKKVIKDKGYNYLPFSIFVDIFRNGRKHQLCDIYIASLNGEVVNAIFIVKDSQSFYHLSSGLIIKGFKDSESPPAKLHHFVMMDCFNKENKSYYNISYGGSDNLVRFKELFNPTKVPRPSYYTFIINSKAFHLFKKFTPGGAGAMRTIFGKLRKLF